MTPRARLIEELKTVVLPWYGIEFAAVRSPLRFHDIKRARDACAWYLMHVKGLPSTQTGTILCKDPTSVHVGAGRHCARAGLHSSQRKTYELKLSRYKPIQPSGDSVRG